jgi:tetratricopeptide (TPR) repeat protein
MSLISLLNLLEAAGLIRLAAVQPELEYLFRHALIQDAAYASLLKADRKRLHLAVGEALERLYPDRREELSGLLAHHFAAAAERDRALEYYRLAARQAEAQYAYEEAVHHLRAALDLLGAGEQTELRLTLLEELADVHNLLGQGVQAILLYQEALELSRTLAGADKWRAVRLHRKIGATDFQIFAFADRQRFEAVCRASLEAGLKLTEGEPPHPETVRLLTIFAYHAWRTPEAAERYARAAVEVAEQLDAPIELSAALGVLAFTYSLRRQLRESMQVSLRRLALSREARFTDLRERVDILINVCDAHFKVGEYAQAMSFAVEAENLCNQIRDAASLVYALEYQSRSLIQLDHWEEALRVEEKRLVLDQHYSREQVGPTCLVIALIATIHARRGETDQATSLREEARAIMVAASGPTERWGAVQHY